MKPALHPACVCTSGPDYAACCGIFHPGEPAPDAETLMRSRYSAYVLGLEAYLLATWHPDTRPERLELDGAPRPRWLGLKILRHCILPPEQALAEFVARYKINGRGYRLHEISRFARREGRWHYLDAQFRDGNSALAATTTLEGGPLAGRECPAA